MKIAIYGAGICGEYIIREIRKCKNSKVEVVLFIDNNPIYQGQLKYDLPVVSLDCFMKTYHNVIESVLIAALDELTAQEMVVSLLNKNYNHIFWCTEGAWEAKLPVLNSNGGFRSYIKSVDECKPILPYMEYHVSDFCNLKCKRCGHFSNLVSEKIFPDINEFKTELIELSKRFRDIRKIRLMGGEPFINPNLDGFIYEARKNFPYSDIRVVTNGILLPKISDQVVEAIRNCGVVIDISQYPPTKEVIERIVSFAQEKKLRIQITKEITKFFKSVNAGISTDYEKIYSDCISRTCHFLRKGHLYVCPAPILFFENKEFLELNITQEDLEKNSFDLIHGNEDGWQILKKFLTPFDFCQHCVKAEWHDWKASKQIIKKEDWIVHN